MAYVRYPGCRHGHVTNPPRDGARRLSAHGTADKLLTLSLDRAGWGGVRPSSRSGPAVKTPETRQSGDAPSAGLMPIRPPLVASRPPGELANCAICVFSLKSLLPSAFGQVPLMRFPLPTSNDSLPRVQLARLLQR